MYPNYQKLGISILIVVGQKRESVKRWLAKHPMPFPFLIDEDRAVIKAFDVYNPISLTAYKLAHPSVFLISKKGEVVHRYVGSTQFDRPDEAQTYQKVLEWIDNDF